MRPEIQFVHESLEEEYYRQVWRNSFGSSPESTFRRLRQGIWDRHWAQCDLSTSHFSKSAREMLDTQRADVLAAGVSRNIDARAIAGAIRWEFEENWRGRLSDWFQYRRLKNGLIPRPNSGHRGGGLGVGEERAMAPVPAFLKQLGRFSNFLELFSIFDSTSSE